MLLIVDDEPTQIALEPDQTVRQIAQAICPADAANARLVVSLRCDGAEISGEALDDVLDQPANRYEEISLSTQPRHALLAQSVHAALALLTETDDSRARAADLFARGSGREAMPALEEYFSRWRLAQEAFTTCADALNLTAQHFAARNLDLNAVARQTSEQLRELKSALQTGDFVLVGDILSFELEEQTRRWRELLEVLTASMQASLSATR